MRQWGRRRPQMNYDFTSTFPSLSTGARQPSGSRYASNSHPFCPRLLTIVSASHVRSAASDATDAGVSGVAAASTIAVVNAATFLPHPLLSPPPHCCRVLTPPPLRAGCPLSLDALRLRRPLSLLPMRSRNARGCQCIGYRPHHCYRCRRMSLLVSNAFFGRLGSCLWLRVHICFSKDFAFAFCVPQTRKLSGLAATD